MEDTEEVTERTRTTDSDELLETYLTSRERHDGIAPTISDVEVTEGLAVDDDPVVTSVLSSKRFTEPAINDVTISDITDAVASNQLSATISRSRSSIGPTFDSEDAKRLLRGQRTRAPYVPLDRDVGTGKKAFQQLQWRYAVSATISDTGLGQRETLRWLFDDRDEAQQFAELLEQAAIGDATASLSYDEGLCLHIEEQHQRWQDKFTIRRPTIEELLDTVAVPSLITYVLTFIMVGALAASLAAFSIGFLLTLLTTVTYTDTARATESADDHTFFDASTLREVLADAAYDYGAVFRPATLSVTAKHTGDAVVFQPVAADDNRKWRLPIDETGTIEHEEHIAFLDAVGSDKIQDGAKLTLWTQATSADSSLPVVECQETDYSLYPTKPDAAVDTQSE